MNCSQDRDLFAFEQSGRRSASSVGGHGLIQDELRYTTEPDESAIESPVMRDMQYASLMTTQDQQPQQPGVNATSPTWDDQPPHRDNVEIERQPIIQPAESHSKPLKLDINKPDTVHVCAFITYFTGCGIAFLWPVKN